MKVFDKKTGLASHHEAVDARELVQSGAYTYSDPNAKPGDPVPETAGEVLRRSEEEREKENKRSQYQQMADATADRDRRQAEEVNPAARAQKAAVDARKHADHLAQLAAAGAHPPLGVVATPQSLAALKQSADNAEKDAKEKEAFAKKAAEEAVQADKDMRKREEEEKAAAEKAAGKKKKKEADTEEVEEDNLDEMSKADLQTYLDKAEVEYDKADLKEDLLKKAKAAQKKK